MNRLLRSACLCLLALTGYLQAGIIEFTSAINGDGVDLDYDWQPPAGLFTAKEVLSSCRASRLALSLELFRPTPSC